MKYTELFWTKAMLLPSNNSREPFLQEDFVLSPAIGIVHGEGQRLASRKELCNEDQVILQFFGPGRKPDFNLSPPPGSWLKAKLRFARHHFAKC